MTESRRRSPGGDRIVSLAERRTRRSCAGSPPSSHHAPPAKYPAKSVVVVAIPDHDVDAWGFETEEPENAREIASEMRLVRPPGEDLGVAVTPRRTWRDRLRGSISKQWTISPALLAAALITVGAISLRGEPTRTTRGPFEALGLMSSAPPVQRSSAVRPRLSTEAEIRSPASKSDEVRVTGAARGNQRPNAATDDRTTPMSVERRNVSAPLTWPIVMSPFFLRHHGSGCQGIGRRRIQPQLLSGGAPITRGAANSGDRRQRRSAVHHRFEW